MNHLAKVMPDCRPERPQTGFFY